MPRPLTWRSRSLYNSLFLKKKVLLYSKTIHTDCKVMTKTWNRKKKENRNRTRVKRVKRKIHHTRIVEVVGSRDMPSQVL